MTKVRSKVILVLYNVRIELSNVRKKKKESPNVTRELSHVMLELHNVRIELSNVKKKNKGTTKRDKRIVTCNVGTAQCENETVKCEKKVGEPPNVTKELSHMMLELHNVRLKPSNM